MADAELLCEASYPMNAGDHPNSYAKNSAHQKGGVDAAKNLLTRAIAEKLDVNTVSKVSNTFRIADLGCSIGPNTFIAVQNIIDAVQLKYQQQQQQQQQDNNNDSQATLVPEFQVFFCDHTTNDFNTLLRTLPPSRQYFAAAVPGSFHRRLLPEAAVHFAHISYAVHWLSRVPKEVVEDRESAAFNKHYIFYSGCLNERVVEAYRDQLRRDMERFLSARGKEIVEGGLLAILAPCAPDEPPLHLQTGTGVYFNALGSALFDMAKEGLISQEKVESFNLPMYFPPVNELRGIIQENDKFSIDMLETFPHPKAAGYTATNTTPSKEEVGEYAAMIRAAMEGVIREHFGLVDDEVDELFRRYTHKLANDFYADLCYQASNQTEAFILLKRNHS